MNQLISGLTKLTMASVLVVTLAACGGAEERKVKYLEKGKAYLAEKNYDKAKIELKNVLQIDPKYPEAYYLMGQLEEANKELRRAIGNYKKALDLDPKHVDAKIKLSRIYVVAGTKEFLDEANKLLNQVEVESPGNAEAELISATIEYKSGSKSNATSRIEALLDKKPELIEGVSLLSSIYVAEGKEDKAISLLKEGVSYSTDNIPLRIRLAKILAKNKEFIDAEKYLVEAINIEPENFSLQVALSSFYATSNQLDKSEAILRQSIEQNDEDAQRYLVLIEFLSSRVNVGKAEEELKSFIETKPEIYELKFSLAEFYQKVGKLEKSKQILNSIISDKEFDKEGVTARVELSKILLGQGDIKSAKTHLGNVLNEYPNNNDALLLNSKLSLGNLDAVGAINGLRTVLKNDPKNAAASLLLAQAHELNKESSLAENELKKAIESNPVNEQTHGNYARYLANKGRIDEAIEVIDKALTYFRDSYDLMAIKLKIVSTQGNADQITSLLDMMEQANSNEADVNVLRGQYFIAKNNVNKALEQFEIAYTKSVDKYQSLDLIVRTYLNTQQADKAIERLNKNLKLNPEDTLSYQLLGQVYTSQKDMPAARSHFLKAIELSPGWYKPHVGAASTYLFENNKDEALKVYESALPKLKNKIQIYIQMASIYESQDDFSKAMSTYKTVLEIQPSHKLAANNYASLLLDHGDANDVSKALELAKGFELTRQPALIDTLGWAYAKSGDNLKAVELLKPIVEQAPKVAVFRYHLGYALYQTGDKEAARSHLEIAVASEQVFPGKDAAEDLLKNI